MAGSTSDGPRSALIAHPSADLYGSDRVMLETIDALRERGWTVTVTLPAPGPLVPEIERRGAAVALARTPVLRKSALKPLGMLKLIGQALASLPGGIKLVRRADLVYVSTLTIPLWLLIGRLTFRPVVCHVHESERSASLLIRRALALPLLLAHRLLVNSEFSRGVLRDSFKTLGRRSEVVYNGVPGPDELVPAREVLTEPIRLFFVGRLAPRKGPQVAISIVEELSKRNVSASLELAGSVFPGYEWFEAQLRDQVASTGLDQQVHFLGFTSVWSRLAASDIVLVPSQGDEPFGNTAVEAVLAGRPVIVSSSSGLDEAVAGYESAQRVPADDLTAWVDAVQRVAGDWPTFRDAALRDAAAANARHAPQIYREQVADRLVDMAARGRRRTDEEKR